MRRMRVVVVGGLLLAMCGLASGQPGGGTAPGPGIEFSTGYPAAGGSSGQIAYAVEWDGCVGLNRVRVKLYETVNGKQSSIYTGNHFANLQKGTYADTVYNLTPGVVITEASAEALDKNLNNIATNINSGKNLSLTVP